MNFKFFYFKRYLIYKLVLLKLVQKNSLIKNSDNSGISILRCISVISKRKESKLLDFIKFSIKKLSKFKKRRIVKVKKSVIYKGIILTVNFFIQRKNGFFLKFDFIKSIGILNNKIIGTKINGNLFRELRYLLFIKKKKSDLIRKIILKSKFIF